jgi:hypothetical protein
LTPSLSVVIPHWPFDDEIDEAHRQCVTSLPSDCERRRRQGGTGFRKNVNVGLRLASGDFIGVVNNDAHVAHGDVYHLSLPIGVFDAGQRAPRAALAACSTSLTPSPITAARRRFVPPGAGAAPDKRRLAEAAGGAWGRLTRGRGDEKVRRSPRARGGRVQDPAAIHHQ